jgi:hypothetical protein
MAAKPRVPFRLVEATVKGVNSMISRIAYRAKHIITKLHRVHTLHTLHTLLSSLIS